MTKQFAELYQLRDTSRTDEAVDGRQSREGGVCNMKKRAIDDDGELLTSEQVMDRLLSDRTLRRLAVTCNLPGVRFGDGWRFRRKDLEAWIKRHKELRDDGE